MAELSVIFDWACQEVAPDELALTGKACIGSLTVATMRVVKVTPNKYLYSASDTSGRSLDTLPEYGALHQSSLVDALTACERLVVKALAPLFRAE